MLGSLTKPTACGDNNNRIISASTTAALHYSALFSTQCVRWICPIHHVCLQPALPRGATYAETTKNWNCWLSIKLPIHPSIQWEMSAATMSLFQRTRCQHNDSEDMQKKKEKTCPADYRDVFQIRFICCAITAVCCCFMSAEEMARVPRLRRVETKVGQ